MEVPLALRLHLDELVHNPHLHRAFCEAIDRNRQNTDCLTSWAVTSIAAPMKIRRTGCAQDWDEQYWVQRVAMAEHGKAVTGVQCMVGQAPPQRHTGTLPVHVEKGQPGRRLAKQVSFEPGCLDLRF